MCGRRAIVAMTLFKLFDKVSLLRETNEDRMAAIFFRDYDELDALHLFALDASVVSTQPASLKRTDNIVNRSTTGKRTTTSDGRADGPMSIFGTTLVTPARPHNTGSFCAGPGCSRLRADRVRPSVVTRRRQFFPFVAGSRNTKPVAGRLRRGEKKPTSSAASLLAAF